MIAKRILLPTRIHVWSNNSSTLAVSEILKFFNADEFIEGTGIRSSPNACNHDSLIQPINTRFHPVIDRIKEMLLLALIYKQIERAVKLHP
jgi:hypothetical protein